MKQKNIIKLFACAIVFMLYTHDVYAENTAVWIELPCGCTITPYEYRCGKCGKFLKYKVINSKKTEFWCGNEKCSHKDVHLKKEGEYYGHNCAYFKCVKCTKTNVNEEECKITFTNSCPKELTLLIWVDEILPLSKKHKLVPKSSWTPDITIPRTMNPTLHVTEALY